MTDYLLLAIIALLSVNTIVLAALCDIARHIKNLLRGST